MGAVAFSFLLLCSRVFTAAWSVQAGNGIPACSHLPVQFRPAVASQHVHCCLFSSGVAWRFIMFTVAR